jgi:hypothetical protein
MADDGKTSAGPAQERTMKAAPVTPSEDTVRPDGLAFDVEKGADLAGVPVGDQSARNPAAGGEQGIQESGAGVGLAVPGYPHQKPEQIQGEQASEG